MLIATPSFMVFDTLGSLATLAEIVLATALM